MKKVSFQGEHGAYSESAAKKFFEEEIKTVPCNSFEDALKITENGGSDYCILPVENSIEDDSVRDRFKTWRRLRSQKFLSDNLGKMVGELFTRLTDSIDAKGSVVTDKMLKLYKEGKSEAEINAVFEKEFNEFTVGRTSKRDHAERLFVCKVQ